MKTFGLWPAAAVAALFATAACTAYEDSTPSGRVGQGEPVEVGFSMRVETLAAGDDATRDLFSEGVQLPTRTIPGAIEDGTNATVKNLWLIQFETGLDNPVSKKMVGVPRFISSTDISGQNGTVQLIGTTDPCYIVWVANHPDESNFNWNLPLNATFGDVAAKMMTISQEADTYPLIDGAPTILMNSITATAVQSGTDLTPVFYRNYAKVSLKLTLDAAATDYKIVSVRLRNVPRNVTLSELALGATFTNIVPSDATIYPYGSPLIDYLAETPTGLSNAGSTETFTWYVPRNQQGSSSASTYNDKSAYAPVNATYFEVLAQRISDNETAVFRVYPGANQVSDYTLLPNHAYTSSLNVKGIGNSSSPDSRVENFDDVDYSIRPANCYILNPAPAGGRTRKYTIPITHAITYWSGTAAGYGNTLANVIKAGDTWNVSVLWSDLRANSDLITFDNVGAGVGPDGTFTLIVPAGLPASNFTVQLKRATGSADILWSWHFWVTDYNPDAFKFGSIDRTTPNPGGIPDGKFTYPVPNGQVERYAGTIWNGAYASKVMMDRSLGAVENYFTVQPVTATTFAGTTRGHLHYQFGRKDPFPTVSASTDGSIQMDDGSEMALSIRNENNSFGTSDTQVPMSQAVRNPTVFYNRTTSAGQWCSNADGYAAPYYVWHDPLTSINSLAANNNYSGKSIYDPCPPGWKVPALGTWDDFSITNGTIQNSLRDLGWSSGRGVNNVNALRYWPGTTTSPVGGRIYYPTSGNRASNTGAVNNSGSYGYAWAAVPGSAANGRNLLFNAGLVSPQNGSSRAYGFPVRCVAE